MLTFLFCTKLYRAKYKSPYVSGDKPRAFGRKHAGFRKRSREVAEKKARGSERQLRPLNFRKSALDKKTGFFLLILPTIYHFYSKRSKEQQKPHLNKTYR